MASIAGYQIQQWRGYMPRTQQPKARLPAAPGVAGNVIVRGFPRIDLARIKTAVQQSTTTGAEALIDAYRALEALDGGVAVVDQFGRVYNNCIVMSVFCQRSDFQGGGARVDASWVFDVPFA
jgi:hypothetical protein